MRDLPRAEVTGSYEVPELGARIKLGSLQGQYLFVTPGLAFLNIQVMNLGCDL